ncbi:MAG: hypothetical protein J6Z03_02645, partial [Erysipelotrichaceae bacterium]|nr:hypothetical protein [Erysipelotrichaceae bacterium]
MKKIESILLIIIMLTACTTNNNPIEEKPVTYTVNKSVEVNGRQGVCYENIYYWVSGSKTL